jgi:tRNA dimethylallyltransferase
MNKKSSTQKNKTCIVIVGPTAIGKTAFAIQVAQHFNTQIISADSRQCFKELNIGVAKPSHKELDTVQHHFINSHSIHDEVNAGVFEKYALQKIEEIFTTNDIAVLVGGTGLYVKTFCQGIDNIPTIPLEIRNKINESYTQNSIEWLQQQIEKLDSKYFAKGEIQNPQRLMRALEVVQFTGKSIIEFQQQQKQQRDFTIVKIGLQMHREDLYNRINNRVDVMMEDGLLEEVKSLLPYKNLNALQTVGYTELFDYLDNKVSLDRAIELIKQNTRHYAKRQITWFKKDAEINWLNATLHPSSQLSDLINILG